MSEPPRYPVMVDLSGRRAMVVGGGSVAARKVQGLVEAGALVTVIAPSLGAALDAALRDRGSGLDWIERAFDPADLHSDGPWHIVVAATDDGALNRSISEACDARGTWAVDASSPNGGAVSNPAVARLGPIAVAVSTSGISPSAAAWLRDQLAAAVDPAVVVALELMAEVMSQDATVVTGHTEARRFRFDWQRVLESGTLDAIRQGHRAKAKERLEACLSSSSD